LCAAAVEKQIDESSDFLSFSHLSEFLASQRHLRRVQRFSITDPCVTFYPKPDRFCQSPIGGKRGGSKSAIISTVDKIF